MSAEDQKTKRGGSTRPRPRKSRDARRRDVIVAGYAAGIALVTLSLSFAAVPFYTWFCKTTGYGGTTQVAISAPVNEIDRMFEIRFDSNTSPGLPWKFHPEVASIQVHGGEVATVNYVIENDSDRPTAGMAVYNVTPDGAGGYFDKIVCFCFTEQKLAAREQIVVPVTFFVNPDIANDRNMNAVNSITLSYTFYPSTKSGKPLASAQDTTVPKL
jgi:cytochrome c oxidase assembly protein subunit 11